MELTTQDTNENLITHLIHAWKEHQVLRYRITRGHLSGRKVTSESLERTKEFQKQGAANAWFLRRLRV
jgi:hypothetical protein